MDQWRALFWALDDPVVRAPLLDKLAKHCVYFQYADKLLKDAGITPASPVLKTPEQTTLDFESAVSVGEGPSSPSPMGPQHYLFPTSTLILYAMYEPSTCSLWLVFPLPAPIEGLKYYRYGGVSLELWKGLLQTDSPGRFYNAQIRGRLPGRVVEAGEFARAQHSLFGKFMDLPSTRS